MEVIHDEENCLFIINVENDTSFLAYKLENSIIELNTTYTPPKLRGRGIAEKLVKAALQYAKENNLKIIPNCSYVCHYLERHPEYNTK